MPKQITIKTDSLIQLPEIQLRLRISNKKVDEYAETTKEGIELPPLDVFVDAEGRFLLADGFHRLIARQQNGYKDTPVLVHECDPDKAVSEAIKMSAERNCRHGLPMSREDRRNAVKKILANKELRRLGDKAISKMCGCSPGLVAMIRADGSDDAAKKKKKVTVETHKRSAPSKKTTPDDDGDLTSERVETLREWVNSGSIEWKDVQEIFASASHFPMLIPKKPHHLVVHQGDKKTRVIVESISCERQGAEQVLIVKSVKKESAVA